MKGGMWWFRSICFCGNYKQKCFLFVRGKKIRCSFSVFLLRNEGYLQVIDKFQIAEGLQQSKSLKKQLNLQDKWVVAYFSIYLLLKSQQASSIIVTDPTYIFLKCNCLFSFHKRTRTEFYLLLSIGLLPRGPQENRGLNMTDSLLYNIFSTRIRFFK